MKEKLKKIDFVSIILIIIFLIVFYCFAQLKILKRDYINFCGYTVFQVITGSMENTIKIKDIIIVEITKDVKENDIITFKSGENFVTHRVVSKDRDILITKGDANNSQDDPINLNDVVGKVVFIVSDVSIWISVLKTPEVIIALVVSIIVIWLLFFRNKMDVKK